MEVTYLGHYGDDLTVVNAARVSMGRKSEYETQLVQLGGVACQAAGAVKAWCENEQDGACQCPRQEAKTIQVLKEKDGRLLKFLATHKHELPFAHPHVSFHFKAPLFVARQLAKHQVGGVWSEISRRYVSGPPEFYWPKVWRKGSADIKQGSLDESIDELGIAVMQNWKRGTELHAQNAYTVALSQGVAPEQARMMLPQNVYTEWHWTGSLLFWSRVWNLRVKPDAQQETREIVEKIGQTMSGLFPVSWAVLTQ